MMVDIATLVRFTIMGFFGGITYVLMWKIKETYEIVRHMCLGAIVGFVYCHLVTIHGYPDLIMAFVAGYFGTDFIEGIIARVKKEEE